MTNKKLAAFLVAGALIATVGESTAFAQTATVTLPLCANENCCETEAHIHDGEIFAAHTDALVQSSQDNSGASVSVKSCGHRNHKSGKHHNVKHSGHKTNRHH